MTNEMAAPSYKIVGLGELLWDLLPTGKQLGGAPANFAYITRLLGDEGMVASRIGDDPLGTEAAAQFVRLNLSNVLLQKDPQHATGTVKVELDVAGQPRFEISESVAWDFLEWTPAWRQMAGQADAACFGSLAQRSSGSRSTILNFMRAMRSQALRIFDVNLRQAFHTPAILSDSMKLADIVKLNHEELPRIMAMLGHKHRDELSSARRLLSLYELQLVCVTRGNCGSLLVSPEGSCEHGGFPVKVADTIGAGDAFTAALVHEYLRGSSLEHTSEAANRVGAWVASKIGAMPVPGADGIEKTLAEIG
jgi:fructokinase